MRREARRKHGDVWWSFWYETMFKNDASGEKLSAFWCNLVLNYAWVNFFLWTLFPFLLQISARRPGMNSPG